MLQAFRRDNVGMEPPTHVNVHACPDHSLKAESVVSFNTPPRPGGRPPQPIRLFSDVIYVPAGKHRDQLAQEHFFVGVNRVGDPAHKLLDARAAEAIAAASSAV